VPRQFTPEDIFGQKMGFEGEIDGCQFSGLSNENNEYQKLSTGCIKDFEILREEC
jgi:hypothetical protein